MCWWPCLNNGSKSRRRSCDFGEKPPHFAVLSNSGYCVTMNSECIAFWEVYIVLPFPPRQKINKWGGEESDGTFKKLVIMCRKNRERYFILELKNTCAWNYNALYASFYVVRIIPAGFLKFIKAKPVKKCTYTIVNLYPLRECVQPANARTSSFLLVKTETNLCFTFSGIQKNTG